MSKYKQNRGKEWNRPTGNRSGFSSTSRSAQPSRSVPVESGSYRFANPYNFVRHLTRPRPKRHVLGDCPPPPHDRYVGISGRITCRVDAVTPLFVSDSHAVQETDDHRSYRFFQVDGKPALPASSLRGMIRSVFETVTNSCMAVFQEDNPYPLEHRPSRAPEMTPARVLGLNDWGASLELLDCTIGAPEGTPKSPSLVRAAAVLDSYPPRVYRDRTKHPFDQHSSKLPPNAKDGMRVAALVTKKPVVHRSGRFQAFHALRVVPVSQHGSLQEDGLQNKKVFGWLHLTGPNIENKHDERLFFRWDDYRAEPPQPDQVPKSCLCKCGSEVVAEYNAHLAQYWERHQDRVRKLGDQRWPGSNRDVPHPSLYVKEGRRLCVGDLVYVMRDAKGNVTALRPVSMPRLRYAYERQSLLAASGQEFLRECQTYNALCPACRTFGWVWDLPPKDADRVAYAGRTRLSHGRLICDKGRLPSTPLAILSTPKPTTTSFYLLDRDGKPNASVDYDTPDAKLRGRKFYRHHGKRLSEMEYRRDQQDDQNRTVRDALKSGAVFEFTLDFENLAPLELGALIYALELEDGLHHRLGYAKPLGFGSVKVTVQRLEMIDWPARLESLEPNAGCVAVDNAQVASYKQQFLDEMRRLYSGEFDTVLGELRALLGLPPDMPIHYPRSTQQPDPNGKNYEWFMGNKRAHPPNPLPLATSDQGLPLIDKKGDRIG